jgi:MFS family permease
MFTGRRPSLVVALAFLVQPLVLDHRVVCNVDILLTFFLVSAVIMLLEDRRRVPATTRLSIAVGLVAGFMLGIKYTAIAPCLALLVLPLVAVPRSVAPRSLAAAVLVAALIFAPWLVKNEIHIGNPVYPMLESTFDGANWDSAQARQLIAWQRGMGMGKGAADYLLLPFNVSLRGRPESAYRFFDGTVSPLLLMLIPLAAIRPTRHTWALAIMAGAVFIFWAVTSQQLRFLMPALALGCVVAAIGLGRLADGAGSGGIKIVTAVAAVVMGFSIVVPDQYGRSTVSGAFGDRLAVALGLEGRRQYLERSVQSYAMFEHINRTVPRREPILMVWENRGYYLDSPYIADSFFEASTVMRMADAAGDAAGFEEAIRAAGIKYVLVNEWLGEYFSRSYPAADTAMLRAFIETSLEPVHTSNRLTLYKIKPA